MNDVGVIVLTRGKYIHFFYEWNAVLQGAGCQGCWELGTGKKTKDRMESRILSKIYIIIHFQLFSIFDFAMGMNRQGRKCEHFSFTPLTESESALQKLLKWERGRLIYWKLKILMKRDITREFLYLMLMRWTIAAASWRQCDDHHKKFWVMEDLWTPADRDEAVSFTSRKAHNIRLVE